MCGLGVPSKSYYNMSLSKPILCIGDENSETVRVAAWNSIGWITELGNIENLSNTLNKIWSKGKRNSKIKFFTKCYFV